MLATAKCFCLTRVIQSPIDVSEQVCAVLEATARFSNQLGRSSPPMMRQKRFELMGAIVSSAAHDSPARPRRAIQAVFPFTEKSIVTTQRAITWESSVCGHLRKPTEIKTMIAMHR